MNIVGTILIVAPHPDDEILGCGWLMRRVVAANGRVVVAWLTDGSASHGDLDASARARLVKARQHEARAGLAALGVTPVATHFLGFRDGDLAANEATARAAVQAICDASQVDTVFVTSDADSHPDHRASFRIATGLRGVDIYAYAVSARYDGDVVEQDGEAVPVTASTLSAVKRAALECHVSQSAVGGARYPLSAGAIDRFCSAPELFVAIGPAE